MVQTPPAQLDNGALPPLSLLAQMLPYLVTGSRILPSVGMQSSLKGPTTNFSILYVCLTLLPMLLGQ